MEEYIFSYKVRLDDLDYMGIVGHSQWMVFLERARIDLLEKISFSFSEMKRQKIGGVVAEARIKYLKSAFFNDELKIRIKPHSLFSKGLILNYQVKNQNQINCISAEITIVFVNSQGESIEMPEGIRGRLMENKV